MFENFASLRIYNNKYRSLLFYLPILLKRFPYPYIVCIYIHDAGVVPRPPMCFCQLTKQMVPSPQYTGQDPEAAVNEATMADK